MKRPLLILLSVASLICYPGCSHYQKQYFIKPKLTSINIIDRNSFTETINNPERLVSYEKINFLEPQPYEKVLRVYSRDEQGDTKAYINTYHENGYPKQYLEVLNSRAYGIYREWFPNGAQKIEAFVIGGTADVTPGAEKTWIFDGECRAWNEKEELLGFMPYCKGELEGISVFYHPNGNIWKSIPYHQNKIEGSYQTFTEDGQLLQKTEYQMGIPNGPSYRYWNQEKISSDELFCEGLLMQGKYYTTTGKLICQIENGKGYRAIFNKDTISEMHEYRNGIPEGVVKTYNKYKRLTSLYHIKNGYKHGEEICFYESPIPQKKPIPKISINWYDGKVQGIVKTWYDNGTQESQKEMSENKKNGNSAAWYRDGSLMMIEQYDHDKLVKGEYYAKGEKIPVSTISHGEGVATIFDAEGTYLRKIIYYHGKPQLDN